MKKKTYQITKLPVCPSVCVHQNLNRLVDFDEIWYGDNAIQGDLEAVIFN
jgi:hypothetical protein